MSFWIWKSRRALLVRGPMSPSIGPGSNPLSLSALCTLVINSASWAGTASIARVTTSSAHGRTESMLFRGISNSLVGYYISTERMIQRVRGLRTITPMLPGSRPDGCRSCSEASASCSRANQSRSEPKLVELGSLLLADGSARDNKRVGTGSSTPSPALVGLRH